MLVFLNEYFYASLGLALLALCGAVSLSPFRKSSPFMALACPLAGLIFTALGLSVLYYGGMGFVEAAKVCVIALTVSSVYWLYRFSRGSVMTIIVQVGIAAVVAAFLTRNLCDASIGVGGNGFLLMDGSDQLGYSQLADWITTHKSSQPPVASPALPYQSWPSLIFDIDPRFGSFYLLALASVFRSQSAMFSYDFACSVVLISAVLGVAAVFSRNYAALLYGIVGLTTSSWFDYSRDGFFGKLLAYPAALFIFGLICQQRTRVSRFSNQFLVLFAVGASLLHSGLGTAGILFASWIGQPVMQFGKRLKSLVGKPSNANGSGSFWLNTVTIGTLCAVALATIGALAKPPTHRLYPYYGLRWHYIWPRILDLDHQALALLSTRALREAFLVAIGIQILLAWVAYRRNLITAFGLLLGPLGLFCVMQSIDAGDAAFQFIGTAYPMAVCAGMLLLNETLSRESAKQLRSKILVVSLCVALVILRIPHFAGSFHRYVSNSDFASARYSKSDFSQIRAIVGSSKVYVDVPEVLPALSLLTELGGSGTNLRWSPGTWQKILEYRHWPYPSYDDSSPFIITLLGGPPPDGCLTILKTRQFSLYRKVWR